MHIASKPSDAVPTDQPPRRTAVLGSPVSHSLSPVLHGAAYAALGLDGWVCDRIECDADSLPGLVRDSGPAWAGFAVTMPGKHAALRFAAESTSRARLVGAANTLVRLPDGGWRADCTDVEGVTGALRAATGFTGGHRALLLGAGGTALASLAAFAELGLRAVTIAVREPARATSARETAERAGLEVSVLRLSASELARAAAEADVVVCTLPAGAVDDHADALSGARCLLDVVYHPWPTRLAKEVQARGGRLATGLDMLLHQAFGQVEQFTGQPAPKRVMRDALAGATGFDLAVPE